MLPVRAGRPTPEWSFELAGPKDDPDIRRLLASSPMPGRVSVTFEREPNYFLGCGTMGHTYQVVVVRHRPSGDLAGIGCRAVQSRFINGREENVGYLSQLRVAPGFRGRWLVSHGFRLLRALDADGHVAGYVTTIVEENRVARGLLAARPRPHFPVYRQVDTLWTLALIVRGPQAAPPGPYQVRQGTRAELGAIVAFLRWHGAAKQFFPAYTEADFLDSPLTLGFRVEDFVVAYQDGALVGILGLWDQSAYKQTVVRGYRGLLRWAKPLYNVGAWLARFPALPRPGQPVHAAYASFICVADNTPEVFHALLGHVSRLAAARGYHYLMVGLAASDPLLPVARERPAIAYPSRLYTVCWKEAGDFHERLDRRVPYVEIAAL